MENSPAGAQEIKEPVKKNDAEFSLNWHLKVLAVIYACLAVFYLLLKVFLK